MSSCISNAYQMEDSGDIRGKPLGECVRACDCVEINAIDVGYELNSFYSLPVSKQKEFENKNYRMLETQTIRGSLCKYCGNETLLIKKEKLVANAARRNV